jgi:hypothetical protein
LQEEAMKLSLALTLAAPLALVPLFVSPAPAATQASAQTVGIVWEPVLVFDATGGTFAGPVHVNMVVYNNGFVSYASDESFFGGDIVSIQQVDPTVIKKLVRKLEIAGADVLGDATFPTPDLPLTTVTFLNGSTNSPSHSFSYTAPIGSYSTISTVVNDFISDYVNTLPVQ